MAMVNGKIVGSKAKKIKKTLKRDKPVEKASDDTEIKKPKKKKKGDNLFGDAWDATKAGAAKVVDGGKAVVSKTLDAAA